MNRNNQKGTTFVLMLVFMGIFLILIGSMISLAVTQHRLNRVKVTRELALQIAEAGLNYYKWHLTRGLESSSGEHEYLDPNNQTVGWFSLEISAPEYCGVAAPTIITSTGWTDDHPNIKRTVKAAYNRPSVAEYAYIVGDSAWVESDMETSGKHHSNKGVRVDAQTGSLITSAVNEWNCTFSFGCETSSCPTDCWVEDSFCKCPAVFGSGSGKAEGFWQSPPEFSVEEIDFEFPEEKAYGTSMLLERVVSASANGHHFPSLPSSEPPFNQYSSGQGYHIIFKDNGTFDLYVVTSVKANYGKGQGKGLKKGWYKKGGPQGWRWNYEVISQESSVGNYSLTSDCSLIFVEDDLWIEGNVKGKITIASADLTNLGVDTDIILNGNLEYTTYDGSDGLLVIGENNISIPRDSPDYMKLDGLFLAQKGRFGRDHYPCGVGWWWASPNCSREELEIYGSVISNGRVVTRWSYWDGQFWERWFGLDYYASGYKQTKSHYDRKLMTAPPPLTPYLDDEFEFVKWEEIE